MLSLLWRWEFLWVWVTPPLNPKHFCSPALSQREQAGGLPVAQMFPHLKPCRDSGSTTPFSQENEQTSRSSGGFLIGLFFFFFFPVRRIKIQSHKKRTQPTEGNVWAPPLLLSIFRHWWEFLESTGDLHRAPPHPHNLVCHCLYFYSWSFIPLSIMDRELFFYNCRVIKDPSGNFELNYHILPALGFKIICSEW